jgi:hypothetical protein
LRARENDSVSTAGRKLYALWAEHLEIGKSYKVPEIIAIADDYESIIMSRGRDEYDYGLPDFRSLLMRQAGSGRDINRLRLGQWFGRIRGRVFDGYRLGRTKESRNHGNQWAIFRAERECDRPAGSSGSVDAEQVP